MTIEIRKLGVLTSGGDSPGMNAAIRAVVRTGIQNGIEVLGIYRGYEGLIDGQFARLESHSVSNIIQRGGTILKSARSQRFRTPEGMEQAYHQITGQGLDALVVIGGDGTFSGAEEFNKRFDFPIVGLPGTIDNDLYGTDFTIGYDTAINTVVDAVDKIRDTASSHDRLFIVEVMGRDAGFIALRSGIAVGAEDILIPEEKTHIEQLYAILDAGFRKNKTSAIIIVAEGDDGGGAYEVSRAIEAKYGQFKTRVTILGHIQRGGSPSCMDRVLASTLGYESVLALRSGVRDVMIGMVNKKIVYTPFSMATKHHQQINRSMLDMARILST
ncbi:MAG: 6-phosphofructokinase [Lentimicrobiaceae bacterium]|nr:6-phosphofructokinase [Lentimicrobiaceae bacterium]